MAARKWRDNERVEPEKTDYLANVAAAMVKALEEAKWIADRGSLGDEFRDLVQRAQELYEIALEELAALPDAGDFILGLARTYGVRLEELLALADESTRQ